MTDDNQVALLPWLSIDLVDDGPRRPECVRRYPLCGYQWLCNISRQGEGAALLVLRPWRISGWPSKASGLEWAGAIHKSITPHMDCQLSIIAAIKLISSAPLLLGPIFYLLSHLHTEAISIKSNKEVTPLSSHQITPFARTISFSPSSRTTSYHGT